MTDTLREIALDAMAELEPRLGDFDAIVCAGDMHGLALGAAISAFAGKPLMMVCRDPRTFTVSLINTFGDCKPRGQRYLYVDDWFTFGKTLREVFDYLDSSGEPAPVVATYEVNTRTWKETGRVVTPS
jgi:orotate phosphoribosyltransferase